MATAGTSAVAAQWDLHILATALLGLAILQGIWVLIRGIWSHRAELRLGGPSWWPIGSAHEHTDGHTIPLGLAVIVTGLTRLEAGGVTAPWLLLVGLALVWLISILCIGRFLWSLASHGFRLSTVDGKWFLVPAALLGTGITTQQAATNMASWNATLLPLTAFTSVLLGWFGYWAVTLAVCVRIRRCGLGGVAQAPWWIAMGCAGLATAALGHVMTGAATEWWSHHILVMAMLVTGSFAVILCVPIIGGSIRFLLRQCRFRGQAVWPPTFSTAVFALGCLQTGATLSSPAFRYLGLGAGLVTLTFWAVTMAWNAKCTFAEYARP